MIQSIQSLRGIFAVLIFLSHCPYGSNGVVFPRGGDIGVAFFFILSGFVLTSAYFNRDNISRGAFLKKRMIKIYPLHLLCALYAIILNHVLSPDIIIPNLLLLQAWIPSLKYAFSLNGVSWYLCDIMFFYLVFYYLLKLVKSHYKFVVCLFVGIILLVAAILLPKCGDSLSDDALTYWVYIFPPMRALDFILGMLLFCGLYHNRKNMYLQRLEHISPHIQSIIEITVTAFFVVCIYISYYIPEPFTLGLWWWLPVCLLILVFFTFSKWTGIISRLLYCKPLVWFGNLSFSFYLLHVLIIMTMDILIDKFLISISPIAFVLLAFTITTFISVLSEKYVVKLIARQV